MITGMTILYRCFLGIGLAGLLAGCAARPLVPERSVAVARAEAAGLQAQRLPAGPFVLAAWLRLPANEAVAEAAVAHLYLEGDGAPWPLPWQPPADPTPRQPLALALASVDPAANVIYLGRPCQYLAPAELAACDLAYWTERRFAPEVIAAYMAALDRLQQRYGIRQWRLIGYSGGGVLATLLAARRQDVALLVSVAAPLALGEWLAGHQATPLTGSLDPLRDAGRLPAAVHYAGSADDVVPPAVVRRFVDSAGGIMKIQSGYDHECCWLTHWPALLHAAISAPQAQ